MNNPNNNYADPTVDEIELALAHIDANTGRDEWARIGMAIKAELGDSGFDVFDRWSMRGDNYNQRDTRDTWRSVKASGGVGIATLFHMARASGYRNDNSEPRQIDPAEAAARRARREADALREAEETERRQARAAADAAAMWEAAGPFAGHEYTDRKAIASNTGAVRVGVYRRWFRPEGAAEGGHVEIPGALLIPIRDAGGRLSTLQAIFPDDDNALGRDRDYLPGGRKQGCYFNIGKPTGQPDELVMIGEGFATVASGVQAMAGVGVVAFDAGNLPEVAQVIRGKLPQARIVLLADNDRFNTRRDGTPYNPGVEKATEAARLVGGLVAVPRFASDEGHPTDFNDLQVREGTVAVHDQISAAMAPAAPAANDNAPAPAAEGFGVPLDVFGIASPPALPLELLPGALVAYVTDQAGLTGCDPGIIGLGALVAAAACITDSIKLQPKRHDPTWTESARLWVAFVGDPSTKKSPAISKAVRHVKRIDHLLADANASAYADYKWQHEGWKDAKKQDKSIPEPKAPAIQRLVVEDTTVEALTEVLKDNPRGVLTLKDELTGWFASMDAYKGGAKGASMDRAHWLESYNGGRRSIDRISRGQIVVPNWSTCIIGGVQPDMIRRVASSMGNDGLLQRFMVLVARPAVMDEDRAPDMRAMERFSALFDTLAGLQGGNDPVRLSEEAHLSRERVAKYAKRLIDAIDHPHIQAWLGKWDGLYARLLLTYHVIDCAERHVYPTSEYVSAATAGRVERLLCGVLLHHAIHFYSEVLDAHERQEHIRQLARLILAKRFTRITKRDITLYWKASRRLEWWELRAIVESLCTMDWLQPDMEAIDTDGKPRAWFVNPAVHTVFTEAADREQQRRREAVEALREMKDAYAAG